LATSRRPEPDRPTEPEGGPAGLFEAPGRVDDGTAAEAGARPARRRRRATTPPPDGSDPVPAPEPARHREGENDDRMRGDRPPHY